MEKESENKKKGIKGSVAVPEGVSISVDGSVISVKGKGPDTKRRLAHKNIEIKLDGNCVTLSSKIDSKRIKTVIGSFKAHIANMIRGAGEAHKYVLKVCSGHFPMTVAVNKGQLAVKNFYGEKFPRVLNIKEGVDVKVDGDKIIVESIDKEKAGQCAASIENLTKRVNFDNRIFQDGLYIIEKSGRKTK